MTSPGKNQHFARLGMLSGSFLSAIADFFAANVADRSLSYHSGFARFCAAFFGCALFHIFFTFALIAKGDFFVDLLISDSKFDFILGPNIQNIIIFALFLIMIICLAIAAISFSTKKTRPLSFNFLTGAFLPAITYFWAAITIGFISGEAPPPMPGGVSP